VILTMLNVGILVPEAFFRLSMINYLMIVTNVKSY
jgi:hypothetical protein